MKPACLVAVSLLLAAPAAAQPEPTLLKKMIEENSAAVDAVLLYPRDVRDAIFEVSTHPEALAQVQGMQRLSREAFRALAEPLPEHDRKAVWELGRYPDLVAALAAGGKKKSTKDLAAILEDQPEEIHEAARVANAGRFDAVVALDRMNRETEASFAALAARYPPATQEALRRLVALPEVLDILAENMTMVVLVGDAYRANPERVRRRANERSLEAARRNAAARESWTKQMQENPEAMAELEKASKEYAKDNGLDTNPPRTTSVTVTVQPYPYWYGYPYWVASPYWYPYPYWYHAGYYYGAGGAIVVVSAPSYHYTYWHVHGPHHHVEYAHLSDHMVHHWERYPHADGLGEAVDGWVRDNRDRMPKDWLRDDGGRAERLAEYGRFEDAYAKRNRDHPGSPVSRETFARERSGEFPGLSAARGGKQTANGTRAKTAPARERSKPSGQVQRGEAGARDKQRMATDRHRGSWEGLRERRGGQGRGGGGRRR